MKGYQLVFSTLQSRKHPCGESIDQWLMHLCERLAIKGVTIVHAAQGIGRDGKIHSSTFFELADEPIEIIINVSEEQCKRLFEELSQEKLGLFYTKTPIEYGTL